MHEAKEIMLSNAAPTPPEAARGACCHYSKSTKNTVQRHLGVNDSHGTHEGLPQQGNPEMPKWLKWQNAASVL
jgi:hypothetical protein